MASRTPTPTNLCTPCMLSALCTIYCSTVVLFTITFAIGAAASSASESSCVTVPPLHVHSTTIPGADKSVNHRCRDCRRPPPSSSSHHAGIIRRDVKGKATTPRCDHSSSSRAEGRVHHSESSDLLPQSCLACALSANRITSDSPWCLLAQPF